jgi:5-methylcytosine-specific restriction endonuclease McrA
MRQMAYRAGSGLFAKDGLEVHHVVKRTQGGSDFDRDRLIALCRDCHAQMDAPFCRGRLVITALGAGGFHCMVQ